MAVIMLVVGLLLGYFGRPLIAGDTSSNGNVAAVTTPVDAGTGSEVTLPTATVDPTAIASQQQELMDYLISNTKHFKGDPNAKVTIIEFSYYQ
jgi:hypothetical protein